MAPSCCRPQNLTDQKSFHPSSARQRHVLLTGQLETFQPRSFLWPFLSSCLHHALLLPPLSRPPGRLQNTLAGPPLCKSNGALILLVDSSRSSSTSRFTPPFFFFFFCAPSRFPYSASVLRPAICSLHHPPAPSVPLSLSLCHLSLRDP